MISSQASNVFGYSHSSNSCSSKSKGVVRVNATINLHMPKTLKLVSFSMPKITTRLFEELNGLANTVSVEKNVTATEISDHDLMHVLTTSNARRQLYAILEAVADRVEMHANIADQRDNWNTLFLNSIDMITLTATTMAGVAAIDGVTGSVLISIRLSSSLLFSAALGMLLVMNKLQPSQLAEEQRNARRLFKQLQSQIEATLALSDPTEQDVKDAMEKVFALDKSYPLPLLGAMLDKFPDAFRPAVWWPSKDVKREQNRLDGSREGEVLGEQTVKNGWSEELEMELREVVEVVRTKDIQECERLGNVVLQINKNLVITGPLLTGIAALGSAFLDNGSWTTVVSLVAGALATAVNSFEHGGQVGMVFEMYRNNAGFFKLLETSIEEALGDEDLVQREVGELLELDVALKLGRSFSELQGLARKSIIARMEVDEVDEFASKLF